MGDATPGPRTTQRPITEKLRQLAIAPGNPSDGVQDVPCMGPVCLSRRLPATASRSGSAES